MNEEKCAVRRSGHNSGNFDAEIGKNIVGT